MKPAYTAWLLIAAGLGLLWWRSRASAQSAPGPAVDWTGLEKVVTAFQPEGATIVERTAADVLPATVDALTTGGWSGASIETADGSFSLTKPTSGRDPLYAAIEQAKTKFGLTGAMLGQAIEQGSRQYAGRTDYLFAVGKKALAFLAGLIPDRVWEAQSLLSDRYKDRNGYWLEIGN